MPYLSRKSRWLLLWPILALLVSGCGPSPTVPTPRAAPSPEDTQPSPTASQAAQPLRLPTPTQIPYPWPPTATPVTPSPTRDNRLSATSLADLHPIPTPAPPPIILGTAIAPPEAQEGYVSRTVVLAPVGAEPGEIGYEPPIPCECCPGAAKATLFAVGFHGDVYIHDRANRRVVQFDAQGRPGDSIALADERWDPAFLAAGPAGEVCLYYDDNAPPPGAACYNQGQWALLYPKPAWIGRVQGLHITEDGTVWLHTEGDIPGGPLYKCCGYSTVMVPVGRNGAAYDEPRQRELAALGFVLPGGSVASSSYSGGTVYLHDRQGTRIYGYRRAEWLVDIDPQGNLWTIEELNCTAAAGRCFLHRARKYTPEGVMAASFDIVTWAPEYPAFYAAGGAVYRFTFNETTLQYRVVRWEREDLSGGLRPPPPR